MASDPSVRSPLKQWTIGFLKFNLYAILLGAIAVAVAVGVAMSSLPEYPELVRRTNLGQTVVVRGADGSVLVSMGPSFGDWLSYDEIPAVMKDAIVSVEDKRFRSHIGVDPIGLVRAFSVRITKGRWTQGGSHMTHGASTRTQQLARNIFLSNNRTFTRKIKEAILALSLERKFSKDQVL